MAKTKLIAAVELSMNSLAAEMDVINQGFTSFSGFEDHDLTLMTKRYEAAKASMAALKVHLDDLQRRESNPKVSDKIKNLKNIFKDKNDLSAKRKAAKDKLDAYQKDLDAIHKDIQETLGVINYAREHYQ